MTIASEIQDLQTNLTSAKSAVTAKGGTVGDTGLAGLASEIASIPSGGGPLASYGTVTYLDGNNVEQTLTLATEDDFIALCNPLASNTEVVISNTLVLKSNITSVTVAEGVNFIPDYFCSYCTSLENVTIPDTIEYIGYGFCNGCTLLDCALTLTNVKGIGGYFLYACPAFNHPINLPNIVYIDGTFMRNCTSFNSSLTLGENLVEIRDNFLRGCSAFAQSLTIPSGLWEHSSITSVIGNYFMQNCNNFTGPLVCNSPSVSTKILQSNNVLSTETSTAPMYTTGVTLTGPYAQVWKDALSDRTSSPYRKLIVGS
ncbi:MAG: leucine-rich repeat protein [Methanobrevibacter sp.]|nr:leucine-rich repeat protein [Methanobrevibacter sp.]